MKSGEELDKRFASYAELASINNIPHRHEPISCPFILMLLFGLFQWSTLQCMGNIFLPLFYHYGEDKDYVNHLHFHQYKIGYIRPYMVVTTENSAKFLSKDFCVRNVSICFQNMPISIIASHKHLLTVFWQESRNLQ